MKRSSPARDRQRERRKEYLTEIGFYSQLAAAAEAADRIRRTAKIIAIDSYRRPPQQQDLEYLGELIPCSECGAPVPTAGPDDRDAGLMCPACCGDQPA